MLLRADDCEARSRERRGGGRWVWCCWSLGLIWELLAVSDVVAPATATAPGVAVVAAHWKGPAC
jgi:hypothetical protein